MKGKHMFKNRKSSIGAVASIVALAMVGVGWQGVSASPASATTEPASTAATGRGRLDLRDRAAGGEPVLRGDAGDRRRQGRGTGLRRPSGWCTTTTPTGSSSSSRAASRKGATRHHPRQRRCRRVRGGRADGPRTPASAASSSTVRSPRKAWPSRRSCPTTTRARRSSPSTSPSSWARKARTSS